MTLSANTRVLLGGALFGAAMGALLAWRIADPSFVSRALWFTGCVAVAVAFASLHGVRDESAAGRALGWLLQPATSRTGLIVAAVIGPLAGGVLAWRLGLGWIGWLVCLGAGFAYAAVCPYAPPAGDGDADFGTNRMSTNPASGLPMMGNSGLDVGGNPYGTRRD